MSISPESVRFDGELMWGGLSGGLSGGRMIGVPLARFPRLVHATPARRAGVKLSPRGRHRDSLEKDVPVAGLLTGRGDASAAGQAAA